MRTSGCSFGVVAVAGLCLALLAQMSPASDALAQQPAPEHRLDGRPTPDSADAPASGIAGRPSPGRGDTAATPITLTGAQAEAQREAAAPQVTPLERLLRSVSDPTRSEPNDFYFLVLAVAIYLACLLVVEHLRATQSEDDDGSPGRGRRHGGPRGDGGEPG
jgi:hypothetical protein